MIVIGTELIERYLADHAGHKGIKAAHSQYQAWLDIVGHALWRNPEDVKSAYPKASILKAGRVVFNIKGNDYRLGCTHSISGRCFGDQILWHPCPI
jgi:mRNA interferase HigB